MNISDKELKDLDKIALIYNFKIFKEFISLNTKKYPNPDLIYKKFEFYELNLSLK